MSLINRMLQDLDARRAGHGVRLHGAVRPLPPPKASRWPLLLGFVAMLALAAGAAFFFYGQGAVLPPLPFLSAPAPLLAPAPAPVAAAAPVPEPVFAPVAAPLPEPVLTSEPLEILQLDMRLDPSRMTAMATTEPATSPIDPPLAAVQHRGAGSVAAEKPLDTPVRPRELAEKPVRNEKNPPPAEVTSSVPNIERSSVSGGASAAENAYQQAVSRLNQGRVQDAIEGLHQVLRLEPGHVAARQLLLGVLLEAKATDAAMQVLQEGLAQRPQQLSWALALARLQLERGALEEACRTLEHSLPAAAGRADYLGFFAHVLLRLKRSKEAVQHYQSAVRLAPGEGRWWLGLGLAQEAEGEPAEARASFLRARQSGRLSSELTALVEQKLK